MNCNRQLKFQPISGCQIKITANNTRYRSYRDKKRLKASYSYWVWRIMLMAVVQILLKDLLSTNATANWKRQHYISAHSKPLKCSDILTCTVAGINLIGQRGPDRCLN
jgi:hypothetical protein